MKNSLNYDLFKGGLKLFGDKSVFIKIADFVFKIEGLNEYLKENIIDNFSLFLCEEKESYFKVTVGEMVHLKGLEDRGFDNFSLYEDEEYEIYLSYYFAVCRKVNKTSLFLDISNEKNIHFAFENCFRFLVAKLFLKESGVLLHASAKAIDNETHIFLGNHFAGKTTAVELIEKGFTIADDVILICKKENGNFFAHPLPAGSKFKQSKDEIDFFKIKSFYSLKKGEQNRLRKMNKVSGFAVLTASCPFNLDMSKVFPICREIVHLFPFYELEFKKEQNFLFDAMRNLDE